MEKELEMSYKEYANYLLDKYGKVPGDYFCNENCKSKNRKIARTKDGLNIHHIDENKIILLAEPKMAQTFPYEHQKADHLVYANLLEHLLLHVKIAEEDNGKNYGQVGIGGIEMISEQINDYFGRLPEEPSGWRLDMFNAIRNNYKEYIELLSYITTSKNKNLKSCTIGKMCSGWSGETYGRIKRDVILLNIKHKFKKERK